MSTSKATAHDGAPRLRTPTDLGANATKDIAGALNALLADTFALYLKTKNFHWHMSGPHFRDYHLLLDEHADQIFAMTDVLAERVRKIGGRTLRSIGDISRQQRIADNDATMSTPDDMLAELRDDNQRFVTAMREAHDVCEEHNDVATTSLLEVYIDETERRVWFLYEVGPPRRPERALNNQAVPSVALAGDPVLCRRFPACAETRGINPLAAARRPPRRTRRGDRRAARAQHRRCPHCDICQSSSTCAAAQAASASSAP